MMRHKEAQIWYTSAELCFSFWQNGEIYLLKWINTPWTVEFFFLEGGREKHINIILLLRHLQQETFWTLNGYLFSKLGAWRILCQNLMTVTLRISKLKKKKKRISKLTENYFLSCSFMMCSWEELSAFPASSLLIFDSKKPEPLIFIIDCYDKFSVITGWIDTVLILWDRTCQYNIWKFVSSNTGKNLVKVIIFPPNPVLLICKSTMVEMIER